MGRQASDVEAGSSVSSEGSASSEERLQQRLAQVAATCAETINEVGFSGTLRPVSVSALGHVVVPPAQLPELVIASGPEADPTQPGRSPRTLDLELRRPLGEGGMGLVTLAIQKPLERPVAVKTLKPSVLDARAGLQLVREAMITGALEHPNVVPVHTLGRDAAGLPVLVMKRIEGVSWRQLITAPDHPAWSRMAAGHTDRLEWHLQVLVQVCNAVQFAHSRRVVHRDLKPDNVMVGEYGEVYVLDWGIALDLEARDPARGAPAGDPVAGSGSLQLVGTPAYMAPEMAAGGDQGVDEKTDVYLLGGLLHEVLTAAPHEFPAAVPAPLAAIVHRAMHADKAARHGSAQELRDDLLAYLRDRRLLALIDEAAGHRRELSAALARPAAPPDGTAGPRDGAAGSQVDRAAAVGIYKLFGAVRFGLEQVIKTDAAGGLRQRAQQLLDECLAEMVTFEVRQGHLEAAELLAAELTVRPAELEPLLAALRQQRAREAEELVRLQQLEKDRDLSAGLQVRRWFTVGFAVSSTLGIELVLRWGGMALGPVSGVIIAASLLAICGVSVLILRRQVLSNDAGRRMTYSFLGALVWLLLHRIVGWRTGMTLPVLFASDLVVLGGCLGTAGLALDRRLLWPTLAYPVFALAIVLFPAYHEALFVAGTVVSLAGIGLVWRPVKTS